MKMRMRTCVIDQAAIFACHPLCAISGIDSTPGVATLFLAGTGFAFDIVAGYPLLLAAQVSPAAHADSGDFGRVPHGGKAAALNAGIRPCTRLRMCRADSAGQNGGEACGRCRIPSYPDCLAHT
jgi:hypothetical protein